MAIEIAKPGHLLFHLRRHPRSVGSAGHALRAEFLASNLNVKMIDIAQANAGAASLLANSRPRRRPPILSSSGRCTPANSSRLRSEQTKELTALGQKMAGESAEPIARSVKLGFQESFLTVGRARSSHHSRRPRKRSCELDDGHIPVSVAGRLRSSGKYQLRSAPTTLTRGRCKMACVLK